MKDRVDERRLTDYVLGELTPEETKELEKLIEDSDELKAEVEEIRSVATLLRQELAEEPVTGLAAGQREKIQEKMKQPWRLKGWTLKVAGGLVAASLVVAVFYNLPTSVKEEKDSLPVPISRIERKAPPVQERMAQTARKAVQPSTEKVSPEAPASTPTGVVTKGEVKLDAAVEAEKLPDMLAAGTAETRATSFESASAFHRSSALRKVAGGIAAGGGIEISEGRFGQPEKGFNTETYDRITENEFIRVSERPLSTFSIDVDTASYANVRRFLNERQLPPKDAVRIEELINYFDYEYAAPRDEHPFATHIETAAAPWKREHLLVRFGLKGREIDFGQRRPGNFVFLIDVSGSMRPENKLPLLKRALRLMVDNLNVKDRVAMAVYAGASGLVLPSTPCSEKEKILQALENLEAGGSTNGGAGIELAYRVAEENFLQEGVNRVILATDGDFNVGVTNQGDLTRLIEEKADSGVFLTVLGFGMGNYKDSTLEKLADRGNGNYSYIDSLQEARKVLVEEMGGTLVTIAKDVKIQVEFNPSEVQAYRLLGYENRLLRDQDFNDDTKDAGEIGAGHTVTVFYELVPHGVEIALPPAVDPLKYQPQSSVTPDQGRAGELLTLKLRYKEPDGARSKLIEVPVTTLGDSFERASDDFRFAAIVAGFGMLLRDSKQKGSLTYEQLLQLVGNALGPDPHDYRKEFVSMIKKARAIGDLEELER